MKTIQFQELVKVVFYLLILSLPLSAANANFVSPKTSNKDIAALGKVWGLLKYHHPAITKDSLNWDQELINILPRYLNAPNPTERNTILLKLVNNLGSLSPSVKLPDSLLNGLKMQPDYTWINKSGFSKELSTALTQISNYHNLGKQKYVSLLNFDNAKNPSFTNEIPYKEISFPDLNHRLLAVFRYWNIVEYWYPYRDLTAAYWGEYLEEFVKDAVEAKDEVSYLRMVQKMVATIKDSHAYAISKKTEELKGLQILPFTVKFIESQAVINSVDNKLYKGSDLKTGVLLNSINGVKIKTILDKSRPFVSASNEAVIKREVAKLLTRTPDSLMKVNITGLDGSKKDLTLKTSRLTSAINNKIFDFPHQRDSTYFLTKEKVLYINVGKFKNADAKAVIAKLNNVKGIVLDARQYPRSGAGAVVTLLQEALMDSTKSIGLFSTAIDGFPGYFKYVDAFKIENKSLKPFKGLVTVLVNEETQSTGEFLTMAYQLAPNILVVGSTTAGADGNVTTPFSLPGNIFSTFTGIGVHYPNKGQTQQIGIIPNVKVSQTIKGFRNNQDELFEKAISLINSY